MPRRWKPTVNLARYSVFTVWLLAFVTYVVSFLLTSVWKSGITPKMASDGAWNVAYVLVPVITAFATFWYSPEGDKATASRKTIDTPRFVLMLVLTLVIHVITYGYFVVAIFMQDFGDPVDPSVNFYDNIDLGIKWLMLLSTFAVVPIGYLLGGNTPKIVAPKPNP